MIHAYRKPFSDTFVLEVEGVETANALQIALETRDEEMLDDLAHHLGTFVRGDEMPPPTEEDGGPFHVDATDEGWSVMYVRGGHGWDSGYTFRRESVAREAAATLNALVEVDNKA